MIAALTRDVSQPASLQPLAIDAFAAAFLAMGGLVALNALINPQTQETARVCCVEERILKGQKRRLIADRVMIVE